MTAITTLEAMRTRYGSARERSVMPSMGEMLKDQLGGDMPVETRAQMLARYAADL